jgi:hypothetical protein
MTTPEPESERRNKLSRLIQMLADEATTDEGYRIREQLEDEVMALADALAEKERQIAKIVQRCVNGEANQDQLERENATIKREMAEWGIKGSPPPEGSYIQRLRAENTALLKRADLLEDKWRQMEAYGFTSPAVTLDRIEALRSERDAALKRAEEAERERDGLRAFKNSVDEALNSGDGTYRP